MRRWTIGTNDDHVHIKVICQMGVCPLVQCGTANCTRMICLEHGQWGKAHVHEDTFDAVFHDLYACAEEGCQVAYCEQHYDRQLNECKPCHDRGYAAAALGATNEAGEPTYLCRQHAHVCQEVVDDGRGGGEYSDDEEREICGFVCCANCINDHQCGDDVTAYL